LLRSKTPEIAVVAYLSSVVGRSKAQRTERNNRRRRHPLITALFSAKSDVPRTILSLPDSRAALASPQTPRQVLVADDSSTVRRIIKTFLAQRPGMAVCGEAVDGLEAVEKARTLKPDLVLLDLAMPEMNGAEAASVLRKMMPEVAIILFTMYSENIGRHLTSAIGIDAVLSKPDGMTALAKAIDTVLDRRSGAHNSRPKDPTIEERPEKPEIGPKSTD
jgi:CheY-like chemotaxis protein